MTRRRCSLVAAAVGSLWSIGLAATVWAHHPMLRPDASGGWPWSLLWFLGAGVFLVAFVATLAVFSVLERRQRAGVKARESTRRS
jgi:hypothetical protein